MQKINILYDGRVLKYGLEKSSGRTGIYFTAKNILKEMLKDERVNLFLYLSTEDVVLKDRIFLSLDLKENDIPVLTNTDDLGQINAFFEPFEKIPDIIRTYPKISCYHLLYDVIPLLFPEYFDSALKEGWFKELINSLNPDDFYFTISKYTKSDFLKYFPFLKADKIEPVLLATNFDYQPIEDTESLNQIKKKYQINKTDDYILSLCSLEPRKNLIRAVSAFIKFIKKHQIDNLVYVLGGCAWPAFEKKFKEAIPEFESYKDKIIFTGYVDDRDLNPLYSHAQWFVYTSLYEGFGMPPLEAMKSACPVITSDNTSLPEVVGGMGLMIDAKSEQAHIKAYETYYFDEKFRRKMAEQGAKRSSLFSWQKTVRHILNQIEKIEKQKNQTPLVSIITPVYNLIKNNRLQWFKENVASVQKQTYQNIEHIVVDNLSTDGTLDILKEYQNKGLISYISEPDKGIYDALNKGILKAKGTYVVCLNSDDAYLDENAVLYEVLKLKEQEADAVYANSRCVRGQNDFVAFWHGKKTFYPPFGQIPNHQTFMIKKDVLLELGLYSLNYQVSADSHFIYKMVKAGKRFVFLDKEIVLYRFGGYSEQNQETVLKNQEDAFFELFSSKLNLSKSEIHLLTTGAFLSLPFTEALSLGIKLQNPCWQQEYFTRLFNSYQNKTGQTEVLPAVLPAPKSTIHKLKFNLFKVIPLLKIKKENEKMKYLLFGFIPIFSHKRRGQKRLYKLLGLPFFKIRKIHYGRTSKYYILNIPVLQISKKER